MDRCDLWRDRCRRDVVVVGTAPGAGLSLNVSIGLIFLIMVAFAYAEVFHNAMLPSVTPADKAGAGIGFSPCAGQLWWGVHDGVRPVRLALPGVQDWISLPSQPSLALIKASTSTTVSWPHSWYLVDLVYLAGAVVYPRRPL